MQLSSCKSLIRGDSKGVGKYYYSHIPVSVKIMVCVGNLTVESWNYGMIEEICETRLAGSFPFSLDHILLLLNKLENFFIFASIGGDQFFHSSTVILSFSLSNLNSISFSFFKQSGLLKQISSLELFLLSLGI